MMKLLQLFIEKVIMSRWFAFLIVLTFSVYCGLFSVELSSKAMRASLELGFEAKYIDVYLYGYFCISFVKAFLWWVVSSFVIHLLSILMDGKGKYVSLLFAGAYPCLFLIAGLAVMLAILDGVIFPCGANVLSIIEGSSCFVWIKFIVLLSFAVYYALMTLVVKFMYGIGWIKSVISVVVTFVAVVLMLQYCLNICQ